MFFLAFDIDDTLYDLCEPYRKTVHDTFGARYDEMIDRLFLRNRVYSEEMLKDVSEGRITKEEYYRLRCQKAFKDCGIRISGEEALRVQKIYQEHQKHLEMSPRIRKLLEELTANGVRMGIISNGLSIPQWKKAETLGITEIIPRERIVISGDIGVTKPDVRIFEIAAERFGIRPEEGWYVGDNYLNDVAASKEAGWHSIWLNRRGHLLPENGTEPDHTVYDEEELVQYLKELAAGAAYR